jgi:CspA family cold shock protein
VREFGQSYGWIEGEGGEHVFAHFSEIDGEGYRTLRRGDRVSYEVEQTARGPRGKHIQIHDRREVA